MPDQARSQRQRNMEISTLNEDEFLNLIATCKGLGNGKIDEKTKKKMEKEKEEIRKAAKEMEKREEKAHGSTDTGKTVDPSTQLWTVQYAPQSLKEICGNKGQVDKLLQWLHDWPLKPEIGFQKARQEWNKYVQSCPHHWTSWYWENDQRAKFAGFSPIEMNASDARSKKLVENGMNINNTSPLDGYIKDWTCFIMDEVDGMSAGGRGGVGALNALIKKSKIPIICIANDRQAQKLKPLISTTLPYPSKAPSFTHSIDDPDYSF